MNNGKNIFASMYTKLPTEEELRRAYEREQKQAERRRKSMNRIPLLSDKTKKILSLVLLIVLSVYTLVLWNHVTLLSWLSGSWLSLDDGYDVMHSVAAAISACAAAAALVCVFVMKRRRAWAGVVLALNLVFWVMLISFASFYADIPYPDLKNIAETQYVNATKDGLKATVYDYLNTTYGNEYKFFIRDIDINPTDISENEVHLTLSLNGDNSYKVIYYNLHSKTITFDSFRQNLIEEKANSAVEDIIKPLIGEQRYTSVNISMSNADVQNTPITASADEILSEKYGRIYFFQSIYIRDRVSTDEAKELCLSLLKNYFCVNMSPTDNGSQPWLGDVRLSLSFDNKYISCGGSLQDLANQYGVSLSDTDALYDAAKNYLDTNYPD